MIQGSKVYYNENDPNAAAWIRQLIEDKLIPDGEVDDRSIIDVTPDDLKGYHQHHFFAGIAGWALAFQLAEFDEPAWTGSCPCQPWSAAGRGHGENDPRHLAPIWINLIKKCKPKLLFGEQVTTAIARGWLDGVFDELETEGYACGATVLPACSIEAPNVRERLYFVADLCREGLAVSKPEIVLAKGRGNKGGTALQRCGSFSPWKGHKWIRCNDGKRRPIEPSIYPLAVGVPDRVALIRGAGNSITPQVAAIFVKTFCACKNEGDY